jgi:hypothetical protein
VRHALTASGLAAAVMFAASVSADVITVAPRKDNTLYYDPAGEISNGSGPGFFTGKTAGDSTRRGLLAFDLSSIPAGSTVTGVTLRLTCTRTTAGPADTTLHRMLADWGEGASNAGSMGGGGTLAEAGDATWTLRFFGDPSSAWATPGGDFLAAPSVTQSVGGSGNYTFASAGMVADVQAWLNSPGSNFGWLVRGNEQAGHTAKRFATREYPAQNAWPLLTVTYTVPAPGTMTALALCALTGARRRRR